MNQEQKDLAIKLIDETVEYYKSNPRSINESDNCVYIGPNGTKCAFSRVCVDDAQYDEGLPASYQKMTYLLPEYQILRHHITFWNKLQRIHDNYKNWEGDRFTNLGDEFVIKFKNYITNDKDLSELIH